MATEEKYTKLRNICSQIEVDLRTAHSYKDKKPELEQKLLELAIKHATDLIETIQSNI